MIYETLQGAHICLVTLERFLELCNMQAFLYTVCFIFQRKFFVLLS